MAHARFRCTNLYKTDNTSSSSVSPTLKSDVVIRSESDATGRKVSDDVRGSKRSGESCAADVARKRLCGDQKEENNNIHVSISEEISPVASNRIKEPDGRDVGSAFRKVEKSYSGETVTPVEETVNTRNTSYNISETKLSLQKEQELIARHLYNKGMLPQNAFSGPLPTGLGLLNHSWMIPASTAGQQPYLDPRLYAEQTQMPSANKSEIVNSINKLDHGSVRSFQNSDVFNKQLLMEQLRKSHLPYMSTANPMVEKILQTTTPTMIQRPIQPLSLAQNWCAKCNATFRMTSDLVYHMRSHHKREFDPIKRKREDKLQCSVCKETFKERHHLTRHMTSHT